MRSINEGGIRAVGRGVALSFALYAAVRVRRSRILRLLLTADGKEGRSELANAKFQGVHLLHCCAGFCYPAGVRVLLEAGVDEAAGDLVGNTPRDVTGRGFGEKVQVGRGDAVANSRMLQRGPAYRARSWAWPCNEEADGYGSGDGDTAAAAASSAVLSSRQLVNAPPVIGVRIFRPKETSRSKVFVRLIGRYCAKD